MELLDLMWTNACSFDYGGAAELEGSVCFGILMHDFAITWDLQSYEEA